MIIKILKLLYQLTSWLESKYLKDETENLNTTYTPLSPVDNADQDQHYTKALIWALKTRKENDIRNIAITGPYGSGKSSILKTFQKRYAGNDLHFLNISLATFKEELPENKIDSEAINCKENISDGKEQNTNSNVTNNLLRSIELSILQQIFYHEKDKNIPDSRFKKIKTRKKWFFSFIGIWFFLLAAALLIVLIPAPFYNSINISIPDTIKTLLHFICLIFLVVSFFVMTLKSARFITGITINKLNIQNAEIEVANKANKSILNHHIDEIIYFFEVTPYNVVVIEDLDRFRQTEIFTKLREINFLLNNSKKTRHKEIVFIYAVRDDMFTDKERTKFFEFIIPIIPVINSSNSSQKLLEKKEKNTYQWSEDLIDSLALFIDDMRLLHNITNEFHLYQHKLTGNLNQDKLLSILVYKNIFPNDFSMLSNNEGVLFDAINSKREYINSQLDKIEKEISVKRDEIKELERIKIKDVKELRSLYILAYLRHLNLFISFRINQKDYNAQQVLADELFEYFLNDEAEYNFLNHNYSNYYNKLSDQSLPKKFASIEKDVSPEKNYNTRLKEIKDWHDDKVNNLKKQIQSLEEKKTVLRIAKIKDLLSDESVTLKITDQKQRRLISVLLRNGYIDENYIDYISIFYEGSITRSDYDFLLNVKSQISSEFTYKLHKIEKLITKINLFDLDKDFVLNNDLVDFVLMEESYRKQKEAIFRKLKDESELSIRFIENFVENGINTKEFLRMLSKIWNNIWNFIDGESDFTLEKKNYYFKGIIDTVDVEDIIKIASQSNLVKRIQENPSFLSIISSQSKVERILEELKIFFYDLEFEDSPKGLLDFVYRNGYYSLTTQILPKWIKKYGQFNQATFDTANYSSILESQSDHLITKIDNQINEYVENVYIKIDTNINEEESALIKLLNHENLDSKNKKAIVEKVITKVRNLLLIEDKSLYPDLLFNNKINATWENVLTAYNESEDITTEMVSFINIIDNATKLSSVKIPTEVDGNNIYGKFWKILLQNNEISDESYEFISKSSPWWYEDLTIENLSEGKVSSLINNTAINPTPKSLEKLKEHFEHLTILLIEKRPKEIIDQLENLELDENDLLSILKSAKLTNAQKNKFVNSLLDEIIFSNDENLLLISKLVLENGDFEINKVLKKKLLFLKKNSAHRRIMLFNKFNRILSVEEIEEFLDSLGKDYAKINNKKKKALIEDNEQNRQMLEILTENLISSYSKEEDKGLRVYHRRS